MLDKLLQIIGEKHPLKEIPAGEMGKMKISGMTFTVRAYDAQGLGHVSAMQASGFFGLMKMDTLVINPFRKDLPLYSYDRILAMGNDTLIVEVYDTLSGDVDLSALAKAKADCADVADYDPGQHWYDPMMLHESIHKKGKKIHTPKLNTLTETYLRSYLALEAGEGDPSVKKAKTCAYVEGLLENGGPSTDVFKKKLGADATARFFREIFFGTQRM